MGRNMILFLKGFIILEINKKEVQEMYRSTPVDGKFTDGEVLKYCYQSLAAGVNSKANFDSLPSSSALELVRFAAEHEVYRPTRIDVNAVVWPYFLQQLSNLVNVLECISTERTKQDVEWAKELLQIAMEYPDYLRMCNVYQIIKSEWQYLENLSITYRLLYAMAVMTQWTNNIETRERLSQILQVAEV